MRSFTGAERRARLARRHFLGGPAGSIDNAVADLVGLHATDPATPYLSLWARLPGFAVTDLDRALYQRRTLVKHLAMRRTLWVVGVDDLPLIQAAASDRVADNERRKLVADVQRAGVAPDSDEWLDRACAAVLAHLADNGPTSARELRAALPELAGTYDPAPGKRWGGDTPLSPRVLTVLAVRGDIVRGPNDGTWTTSRPRWAAATEWLTEPAGAASPESARAELVRTWLRTFGPATVTDIKWWFGNTLTWARHALRDIGAVEVDVEGTPGYALPDDLEEEAEHRPVGRAAAGPGRDHDGLVRPRLVSGRASQPGLRYQRQRRADGLVERPGRRRLDSGRGRPGRVEAAGRRRTRRPEGPGGPGKGSDRVARRRADQPAVPVAAVETLGEGAPLAITTGIDVAELVCRIVCTTATRSSIGINWPGMQPRDTHCG